MAAAPELFDKKVRRKEADDDDEDNVVGDWDLDDDLVVGGVLSTIFATRMIPTMMSIWLWGGVLLVTIIKR